MGLSDTDRAVLTFEQQWSGGEGAKTAAVLETFGLTLTRYTQRLNALLDDPDALAHSPVLVNRLRRVRQGRRRR